jgi:hypothetical protein
VPEFFYRKRTKQLYPGLNLLRHFSELDKLSEIYEEFFAFAAELSQKESDLPEDIPRKYCGLRAVSRPSVPVVSRPESSAEANEKGQVTILW